MAFLSTKVAMKTPGKEGAADPPGTYCRQEGADFLVDCLMINAPLMKTPLTMPDRTHAAQDKSEI